MRSTSHQSKTSNCKNRSDIHPILKIHSRFKVFMVWCSRSSQQARDRAKHTAFESLWDAGTVKMLVVKESSDVVDALMPEPVCHPLSRRRARIAAAEVHVKNPLVVQWRAHWVWRRELSTRGGLCLSVGIVCLCFAANLVWLLLCTVPLAPNTSCHLPRRPSRPWAHTNKGNVKMPFTSSRFSWQAIVNGRSANLPCSAKQTK